MTLESYFGERGVRAKPETPLVEPGVLRGTPENPGFADPYTLLRATRRRFLDERQQSILVVTGRQGAGKSTLISHFLRDTVYGAARHNDGFPDDSILPGDFGLVTIEHAIRNLFGGKPPISVLTDTQYEDAEVIFSTLIQQARKKHGLVVVEGHTIRRGEATLARLAARRGGFSDLPSGSVRVLHVIPTPRMWMHAQLIRELYSIMPPEQAMRLNGIDVVGGDPMCPVEGRGEPFFSAAAHDRETVFLNLMEKLHLSRRQWEYLLQTRQDIRFEAKHYAGALYEAWDLNPRYVSVAVMDRYPGRLKYYKDALDRFALRDG